MAGELRSRPLTELRGIAQSFSIPDIFTKDATQLAQAIEMKQQAMIPEPVINIPLPEYDARLMTRPPAKKMTEQEARQWIQHHTERGLKFEITDNGERWKMVCGKKNDEGTLRMPPRTFLKCADKVIA